MLDDPLAFLTAHPTLVVVVVFGAAFLEHVFPPFWGDTLMLIGCFLAGLDRVSVPLVFAAAFVGSCVGAVSAYGLGLRFGGTSMRFLSRSRRATLLAEKTKLWYANHGARVLAFNRFLPGVRSCFLYLAGIGRMRFRDVLIWSSVSNLLYCSLLLAIGVGVGGTATDFQDLQGQFRTVSLVAAIVALTVIAALTIRYHVLRRKCSSEC